MPMSGPATLFNSNEQGGSPTTSLNFPPSLSPSLIGLAWPQSQPTILGLYLLLPLAIPNMLLSYLGYLDLSSHGFPTHPSSSALDGPWSHPAMFSSHRASLPSLPKPLWTINITTYITTVLSSIDNYFSWETQFTSFVIMYQLQGMLDGNLIQPALTVLVAPTITQPKPAYSYWLCVDQLT